MGFLSSFFRKGKSTGGEKEFGLGYIPREAAELSWATEK